MATTTNDGSTFTYVSGSNTWATTASAYDGSATTYTSLTTTTAGAHVFDVGGYAFSDVVGQFDTLTSVVVNVSQYVSNAARWNNPTIQAYDGTTAIGSPATLTERTTAGNENVTLSSVTLAQVRSADFKLRFTANKSGTTSAVQYFGWANVTVTYDAYIAARTGTVAGTVTVPSGTVTGADKGGKGTAAGTVTAPSGTVSNADKATTGTVAGSVTAPTGTVAGTKQEGQPDRTGSVAGTVTAPNGTVAATTARSGQVAATATVPSGTAEGIEGRRTQIAGVVPMPAVAVAATAARTGAVAELLPPPQAATDGTTQRSGTVAGIALEPAGTVGSVAPPAPVGEASPYSGAPRYYYPQQPPEPIRRVGTVHGQVPRPRGVVHGTRRTMATVRGTVLLRHEVRGVKHGCGHTTAVVRPIYRIRGRRRDPVYESRRRRDEDDLLLLIEMEKP